MSDSAEYVAMRRRMSRLRVKCGKNASMEAEDASEGGDPGFRDLVKYWKKHGIPIPEALLSDMADENVKQARARGKGRRRSKELEDLHLCASTGKLHTDKLHDVAEEDDSATKATKPTAKKPLYRRQTDAQIGSKTRESSLGSKPRESSLKKSGSKSSLGSSTNSPRTSKKPIAKTISSNK
ncbi:uncharacterized protein LOC128239239 [Mya arenaria]|uniref:uncharacterized protein LOC128239239 n=1 Tax=Mya arenaria TaxID=6604 RepID=UPI0022E1DB7C|nr:uncharacterized protein LOC128239239 [Mya arenaria]